MERIAEENKLLPGEIMDAKGTKYKLDVTLEEALYQVLHKIPYKVLEHVKEKCDFISLRSGEAGFYYSSNGHKRSLIILSAGIEEKDMENIIAHEIAHSFLKHRQHLVTIDELMGLCEREKDADELITKWGFQPAYKNSNFYITSEDLKRFIL